MNDEPKKRASDWHGSPEAISRTFQRGPEPGCRWSFQLVSQHRRHKGRIDGGQPQRLDRNPELQPLRHANETLNLGTRRLGAKSA